MMKRILLTGAALVALTGAASAQNAAPVFTWNGPYIGAFGGYGFGYAAAANDPTAGFGDGFDEGAAAVTMELMPQGMLGGITLGYNHQSGAFVVGAEATAGYMGLADTFFEFGGDTANATLDDDEGAVGYGWYATLTGRVGVAFDRTLLFATAGGIITQYAGTYGDLDNPGVTDPSDTTTLFGPQFGYLVGGGAEFAFDANWTARLEYNYFDLGTDTTTNTDGDVFVHRNNAHLVRFGLNYLFPY